jgi:hypothetical protein
MRRVAQFVVNITGRVEITVSDGDKRSFGPGTILLAEDVTGKGHTSRGKAATSGCHCSSRSRNNGRWLNSRSELPRHFQSRANGSIMVRKTTRNWSRRRSSRRQR